MPDHSPRLHSNTTAHHYLSFGLILFAFSQADNRQALEQNFCHAERAVCIRARNAVITARVAIPTAMYQTFSFWVRVMLFYIATFQLQIQGKNGPRLSILHRNTDCTQHKKMNMRKKREK